MNDFDEDEVEEFTEFETGPFCRHFGDPSDCREKCANPDCGHECTSHGFGDGASSECSYCDCKEWQYAEED